MMNTRQRRISFFLLGRACLLMAVLWQLIGASARAQAPLPWTEPVSLSDSLMDTTRKFASAAYPVLVADGEGDAHLLFPALLDPSASGAIGDTLYYVRGHGAEWSDPVDIFYLPGRSIWLPQAAIDSRDVIHLVWLDAVLGKIRYTSAPAARAGLSQAWAQPEPIVNEIAGGASLGVAADDTLLLAFCPAASHAVEMITSVGGSTWSEPSFVGEVGGTGCTIRQAVDKAGRVHLVWAQQAGGDDFKNAVAYYAQSADNGNTWSSPRVIDRYDSRFYGSYAPANPSVIAVGADEILIVWLGSPSGQRWQIRSIDGGHTWSPPAQLWPDFRGLTAPPSLTVDSLGRVHMVSLGWIEASDALVHGVYHTYLENGRWARPRLLTEATTPERGGQRGNVVTALGNRLYVVSDNPAQPNAAGPPRPLQISAQTVQLDAPAEPTRQPLPPTPTPAPARPSLSPAPAPTGSPASRLAVQSPPRLAEEEDRSAGAVPTLVVSLLPAALLVLVAAVVTRAGRGRR